MAEFKPGRLARHMKADGLATCICGGEIFYGLVRMTQAEKPNILSVLHCVACDEETVVPLDGELVPRIYND
jgi:hypothetical protein|tara:strand:- start:306 stop:518 length:213 start_codon:yes stop_codon:yes gene_type:complete